MFAALMALTGQFATVTGIAAGTVIADLYLVPAIDGTNYPDIDLTAGTSYIPFNYLVGSFIASKIPTAATNALFTSPSIDLQPVLYRVYILNRAGQTMTANWSLSVVASAAQYT